SHRFDKIAGAARGSCRRSGPTYVEWRINRGDRLPSIEATAGGYPSGTGVPSVRALRSPQGRTEVRIGVVGCGYWGSKHVRVLHGIQDVERGVPTDPRGEGLRERNGR